MKRSAFTLVELVVVVMILGILATIAAAKLLSTSDIATENAIRQNLSVLRDVIDKYAAQNQGALPGDEATESDFKSDLAPHLRRFPMNPLKDSDGVYIQTTGAPFTGAQAGAYGWLYDTVTGDIRANSNGMSCDGVRRLFEL